MTKHPHRHRMMRRRFLQACACAGAAGAFGAAGYVAANTPLPAPRPGSALVDPFASGRPEPGAPILLVLNARTTPSFGAYLGAILRAEGFAAFRVARLDDLDLALLARFPLALLVAGELTPAEVDLFHAYVRGGGNLIAFRADYRLADLMGLSMIVGSSGDSLLAVADHPLARGVTGEMLQLHTPVDHYELNGAEAIAWTRQRNADTPSYPAVTLHRAGNGMAALWAFDLPHSIALIRQGNPALVNQEHDGMDGVRAVDLFVDWVDLDRIAIPQADELQRLLGNMIDALAGDAPLPRLWYLPHKTESVLVATGDAHGSLATHVEAALNLVDRHAGAMSIYYAPPPMSNRLRTLRRVRWWAAELPVAGAVFTDESGYPTPTDVARWRDRGHGFGLHPYVEQGVEAGYNAYWNTFVKLGYGPAAPTVRTHRVLWSGWVDTARVQAQYDLRMSLDHYHSGPSMRRADGSWGHGYLTGSGLPLPFVDEQGNLLRVYQQHTHIVDEHLMAVFDTGYEIGLGAADAIDITRRQIDEARRRYPSALGLQCHIDPFAFGGVKAEMASAWFGGVLEHAAAHRVAIVSAEQWLDFTEMRDGAVMQGLVWDAAQRRLSFELIADGESDLLLELLVPVEHQRQELREIMVDGSPVAASDKQVGGVRYGAVAITAGRRRLQIQY